MPYLHEVWPGRNRFICGGMTGPKSDCGPNLCWLICALVILILLAIFVFPTVWN